MTHEESLTNDELVIPVYLDTNVLLDLLATVEDGFKLVERVTTGQTSGKSTERSGDAEFATPSLFNFFKVGFSGKLRRESDQGASETSEAELTHTYGSLLHRLRRYLVNEHLVRTLTPETDDSPLLSEGLLSLRELLVLTPSRTHSTDFSAC